MHIYTYIRTSICFSNGGNYTEMPALISRPLVKDCAGRCLAAPLKSRRLFMAKKKKKSFAAGSFTPWLMRNGRFPGKGQINILLCVYAYIYTFGLQNFAAAIFCLEKLRAKRKKQKKKQAKQQMSRLHKCGRDVYAIFSINCSCWPMAVNR